MAKKIIKALIERHTITRPEPELPEYHKINSNILSAQLHETKLGWSMTPASTQLKIEILATPLE